MSSAVICLIVLVIMLILYITNKVPFVLVAMGACFLLVILGVMKPLVPFQYFSNDTVILIGAMLLIGMALFETGVAQIIGETAVRLAGGHAKNAVFILLFAVIGMSAFLSNTTITVTFLPVMAAIVVASKGQLHEKTTMMPLAIASCMGGNLTLVGSTPQVILKGIMETQKIPTFGFFEYALIGVPLAIVFLLYYLLFSDKLGKKIFGSNPEHSELMLEMMETASTSAEKSKEHSKSKQILSGLIFVITAICLIAVDPKVMPIGTISSLGAFLMIITGCLPLKTAIKKFDWATIIFFAGVLSFASVFSSSGAGKLIADAIVNVFGGSNNAFLIFAVFCIVITLLTQIMNNTALASLMGPIALAMALTLKVSPMPLAMGVIICSSLSIATPIATSPMTLIFGIGGYKFTDYVKYGGLLNLITLAMSIILIPIIWPF